MSDNTTGEILDEGDLAEALMEAAVPLDEDGEVEITEAFITGEDEDTVYSAADVLSNWTRQSMRAFGERTIQQKDAIQEDEHHIENLQRTTARALVVKSAKGTTQQQSELGHNKLVADVSMIEIVEPPYPPELLSAFLEVDVIHYRSVRTKVTDSVGRDYQIVPMVTVKPDEDSTRDDEGRQVRPKDTSPESTVLPVQSMEVEDLRDETGDPTQAVRSGQGGDGLRTSSRDRVGNLTQANSDMGHRKRNGFRSLVAKAASLIPGKNNGQTPRRRIVSQAEIDDEVQVVEDFIEDANEVVGFEGVLDRACMDYEAIGWGAIEVIRSLDMKVRRIAHAPAVRMRVLKGWKGFVEVISNDRSDGSTVHSGKYMYYQSFGNKITSKRRNPITGTFEPFDPKIDGEPSPETARWNLVDRETGKPTEEHSRAANEIVWIPRHHSNTIYYGYTDVVPALGWLLANVHIRDYLLQFFEHNTVPRYAIIIEGAKLAEPVKKAITAYFSTHVKGKAHKTLIVPIPAMRGEVKVRFERLDADVNEASFQDTKKNNDQSTMAAHGVSPAIIGISEHSELGSGKGLSQAEIYKDRIVTPSQKYWARKINKLFRCGLGTRLVAIKFNPLDIRDEKAEMEVLSGYLVKGCITINAIRKRASLGDPLPGGDRPFFIMGNKMMFVDEMTEAAGDERVKLEEAIEKLQGDMKMQTIKHQSQVTAQRQEASESEPPNSPKPKNNKTGQKVATK